MVLRKGEDDELWVHTSVGRGSGPDWLSVVRGTIWL